MEQETISKEGTREERLLSRIKENKRMNRYAKRLRSGADKHSFKAIKRLNRCEEILRSLGKQPATSIQNSINEEKLNPQTKRRTVSPFSTLENACEGINRMNNHNLPLLEPGLAMLKNENLQQRVRPIILNTRDSLKSENNSVLFDFNNLEKNFGLVEDSLSETDLLFLEFFQQILVRKLLKEEINKFRLQLCFIRKKLVPMEEFWKEIDQRIQSSRLIKRRVSCD